MILFHLFCTEVEMIALIIIIIIERAMNYRQLTGSVDVIQVMKMLLIIIAVFLICWGPKLLIAVLKRYDLPFMQSNVASFYITVSARLPHTFSLPPPPPPHPSSLLPPPSPPSSLFFFLCIDITRSLFFTVIVLHGHLVMDISRVIMYKL